MILDLAQAKKNFYKPGLRITLPSALFAQLAFTKS
jgi:hypothetical protein